MKNVLYEQTGEIAIVTINRPESFNALNLQTLLELEQVVHGIDPSQVRCVIVTGAGEKSFVAGADISEMVGFGPAEALMLSQTGNRVMLQIEQLSVPVIAAVGGYALGGGCELALACDIRLASEKASFAQPEVGLGIPPGFGGTQRLARLIGTGRAKEMIYTAKRIKADEALSIGLVNAVYPAQQLMNEARALAERIAGNVPFAVRASKAVINAGMDRDIAGAVELEAQAFSDCFTTEDRREAMSAFVEKRKPAPFQNK